MVMPAGTLEEVIAQQEAAKGEEAPPEVTPEGRIPLPPKPKPPLSS